MFECGSRGACEAVVRISGKTLDYKGSLSSGDGSDSGKYMLCSCECRTKDVFFLGFIILYFFFFYVILCVFDIGL